MPMESDKTVDNPGFIGTSPRFSVFLYYLIPIKGQITRLLSELQLRLKIRINKSAPRQFIRISKRFCAHTPHFFLKTRRF